MIPDNLDDIATNINRPLLERIVEQINAKKIKFTNTSLYAHSCGADFTFEGKNYHLEEEWEVVDSIYLQEDKK